MRMRNHEKGGNETVSGTPCIEKETHRATVQTQNKHRLSSLLVSISRLAVTSL